MLIPSTSHSSRLCMYLHTVVILALFAAKEIKLVFKSGLQSKMWAAKVEVEGWISLTSKVAHRWACNWVFGKLNTTAS